MMQTSFLQSGRLRLSALFLASLSIFHVTIAAPVSQVSHDANVTLVERAPTKTAITFAQYTDYLNHYYPDNTKYMLYSASSNDQAAEFGRLNEGFHQYYDFFDPQQSEHWSQAFDGTKVRNDPKAASSAIATLASDTVWVFGAVEYQQHPSSYYFMFEAPPLAANYGGKLKTINHMNRGASATSDVLATEDGSGKITYLHDDGSSNATGAFGDCSATLDPPTCDVPDPSDGSTDS